MAINFKKILLAGTALVAVAAFSAQASAAVVPVTSGLPGTWSSVGTHLQDGTLGGAAAGDTIAAAVYLGNLLTIQNNGTANDGSGLNTFSLGAIATNTAAGALTIQNGSANDLAVTIASQTFTTTAGATTITNAGQLANGAAVTYTGNLATSGTLIITNVATTANKTVAATLNGAANSVTGVTTITGGVAAGADTTLNLNGAANTFTGLVTLDDGVAGLAKLNLGAAVTGVTFGADIKGASAGEGTLTVAGSTVITGTIGAGNALKAINAGATGTTSSVTGAVTATTTNITGTGTLAFGAAATTNVAFGGNDGVVTIAAGGNNLTGTVDTTTAGTGTLTLLGATTVSGAVGGTAALKVINAGAAASVFSSDVKATTLNDGASTVALNGNFTGTLNFTGDGTTTVAAGKSITGAVTTATTNTGTVALAGAASGVTGQIGTAALLVKAVTIGGAGADTFGGDVFATTTTLAGASTVALNGSLTGTTLAFGASAGTVVLADGKNITAAITTTAATSTLTLSGTSTITGQVGATGAGNQLSVINAGVTGKTATFANDIFANTLAVGSGNVVLNGSLNAGAAPAGALLFNALSTGTVTVADAKNINGTIGGTGGAAGTGIGNVVFSGTTTGITTIGATGVLKSLTITDAAAQKTVTTSGAVLAADTTNLNDNVLAVTGAFTVGAGQTLESTLKGSAAAAGLVSPLLFGNVTATTTGGVTATSAVNLTTGFTGFVASGAQFKIIDAGAGAANTLGAGKLTVNGVNSGTGLTVANGLLTYSQTADANDLIITATRTATATASGTENGGAVGTVLDTAFFTTGAGATGNMALIQANMQNAANTTALNNVLDATTPTVDGSAAVTALDSGAQVQSIDETRIASIRSGDATSGVAAGASANGWSLWVQGYGQHANQDAKDGIQAYDSNTLGGAVGVDSSSMMNNGVLGLSFNYGKSTADSKNANTTSTDVDNYGVTLYGSYDLGHDYFVNGLAGFAYNKINMDRHNVGGIAGVTANGDTNSDQYSAKVSVGRDYSADHGLTLTPTVSGAYTHLITQGYTETGAGAADLVVSNSRLNVGTVGVGGTATWNLKNTDGSVLKPAIHAGYTYDLTNDRVENTATFNGVGAAFSTQGARPDRSELNAGVGIVYATTANWDLSANYDYTYRANYEAHAGVLRATSRF